MMVEATLFKEPEAGVLDEIETGSLKRRSEKYGWFFDKPLRELIHTLMMEGMSVRDLLATDLLTISVESCVGMAQNTTYLHRNM